MNRYEQAVAVLKYQVSERKSRVKKLEQRMDLTEEQKIRIGKDYELFRAIETVLQEGRMMLEAHMGRIPPQAVDLESKVLGAIMLHVKDSDIGRKAIDHVKSFLLPIHFYNQAHQEIYSACLQLDKSGRLCDMGMVVAQLRQNKTIEQVGGAHYIAELTSQVSSAASIDYHARVILEQAMKREAALVMGRMCYEMYEPDRDIFVALEEIEAELKRINSWIKQ